VLFLCVPRESALDWIRLALHAEVPCIDCTGAVAEVNEVPLLVPELGLPPEALAGPVLAVPPGPALAWALVLAPIHARARLRRVVATGLESVSSGGRSGVDTLRAEVISLFNQTEPPDSSVFPCAVAFDCVPQVGAPGTDEATHEATGGESDLTHQLGRLLRTELALAVTSVQVPAFAGIGASLALETEEPLAPAALRDLLGKAPGVEVWDPGRPGPTTREPTGRGVVLVGRIRRDPSVPAGLLLWLAADPVRLAAQTAVRLAELRFEFA
jgi:aspartate-semialdehyde dehydrogenase